MEGGCELELVVAEEGVVVGGAVGGHGVLCVERGG